MNHYKFNIPEYINYLSQYFFENRRKLYIVGGFVRDAVMGKESKDIDLAGKMDTDDVAMMLRENKRIKVIDNNMRLGTLKIIIDDKNDAEYTCFRTDSYALDGSHEPLTVTFTDDIRLDAKRRDFTVNSIYYDIIHKEIHDFFDGIRDINSKTIKAVRDPDTVFSEDALRILRMCRFSAQLGFDIDKKTMISAKKYSVGLKNISLERIGIELNLILQSPYIGHGISALFISNSLKVISPEIIPHKSLIKTDINDDIIIKWALFLDSLDTKTAVSFINHLALGIDLSNEVGFILRNRDIEIEGDGLKIFLAKSNITRAQRLVSFMKYYSEKIHNRLAAVYDIMIKNGSFIALNEISFNGNDIKNEFGITDGIEIGKIKEFLYEHVILVPEDNNKKALKRYFKNNYDKS